MKRAGRLLRHALVYAAANGLQRLTGFLLIPLYTRILDVDSYGTMEVLATLTNSALVVATLGLPSAFNKCYYRDCDNHGDQKRLTGTFLWLIGAAAVVVVAAGFFLAGPLAGILLGSEQHAGLVMLSLISTACFALAQVPLSLLRARESSLAYSILSFWQFLSMMGLNLLLVGKLGMALRGILLGSIGASSVVILSSLPFLIRQISFEFSPKLARALLSFSLPMVPVAVCAWVMNMSDRWMLNFLSNREQVGLYGLGYRFGMLVEFLLVLPFQLAWPAFYFREAARPEARDIYARVLTWYFVIGGWITLSVALGGEVALRLMSKPVYWPGASVIPPVAAAYFLNGLQYCVAPGVHLGRKTHLMPVIAVCGAGSNLLLTYLWIPHYGMMGAAMATLVSFALLCLVTAYVSFRAYAFRFEVGRLCRVSAALVGLAFVGLAFHPQSLAALCAFRAGILLVAAVGVGFWCRNELDLDWPWKRESRQGWLDLLRQEPVEGS